MQVVKETFISMFPTSRLKEACIVGVWWALLLWVNSYPVELWPAVMVIGYVSWRIATTIIVRLMVKMLTKTRHQVAERYYQVTGRQPRSISRPQSGWAVHIFMVSFVAGLVGVSHILTFVTTPFLQIPALSIGVIFYVSLAVIAFGICYIIGFFVYIHWHLAKADLYLQRRQKARRTYQLSRYVEVTVRDRLSPLGSRV